MTFPQDASSPTDDHHVAKGQLYQQWLNGPQGNAPRPCPIQPSTLQYNQLNPVLRPSSSLAAARDAMPDTVRLAQSEGIMRRDNTFHKIYVETERRPGMDYPSAWAGLIAPGHIFIEYFARDDRHGPFISEVTAAIYQHYYPLRNLRTVFLMNVRNEDTRPVLESVLFDLRNPGSCVLAYDSIEYQRVLGTELGRCVACFVLGAFEHGTRRISEIGILVDDYDEGVFNLRFEIWPIEWPVICERERVGKGDG